MQSILYETYRAKLNGGKVDDKWLCRFLFEVLNRFSTNGAPPVHELVYNFDNEALRYKLKARQMYGVCVSSDCIRYGWAMAISGKQVSVVTLPSSLQKRWKIICYKALELGYFVGVKQAECQSVAS